MKDTNGNYMQIEYAWGAGAGGPNSSARITNVRDGRLPFYGSYSYGLAYAQGHLASLTSYLNTSESHTFTYAAGQPLVSPLPARRSARPLTCRV